MANSTQPSQSFSTGRKWGVGFNVIVATTAVFLILAGINYLSSQYFSRRFYLSSNTGVQLSSRTINFLRTLTNHVDVIVYYDRNEEIYTEIMGLLGEYQAFTHKISVKTVDYIDNPGEARAMKVQYDLGSATNKDFIIFACDGRKDFVDGNWISSYGYDYQSSTNQEDHRIYLNRKRTAFNGETLFTAKLFAVTQAKPLTAYFLQGHRERSPDDQNETEGYSKLAEVFHRNYVKTETLELRGTNVIPPDCNLLVIASPRDRFETNELEKISQYLDQGGRLFVLFDVYSTDRETGLEAVLAKWNVRVTGSTVSDSANGLNNDPRVLVIPVMPLHEVLKPLGGSDMYLVMPRAIGRNKPPAQTATDEPQVTELVFSSTNSTLATNPAAGQHPYSLMVAVEKSAAKGIVTERGTTRMLIAGDSVFLENQLFESGANRDFADAAVNWLLERPTFLTGIGPRIIKEYRLQMKPNEVATVKGLLLGAIPGGILLFGGLVWLRRRK